MINQKIYGIQSFRLLFLVLSDFFSLLLWSVCHNFSLKTIILVDPDVLKSVVAMNLLLSPICIDCRHFISLCLSIAFYEMNVFYTFCIVFDCVSVHIQMKITYYQSTFLMHLWMRNRRIKACFKHFRLVCRSYFLQLRNIETT